MGIQFQGLNKRKTREIQVISQLRKKLACVRLRAVN